MTCGDDREPITYSRAADGMRKVLTGARSHQTRGNDDRAADR